MNIYEVLIEKLEEAKKAATMDNASFGFPNDRIKVESVHFGDADRGRTGDIVHPDTYIKNITRLFRHTWIIAQLEEALMILKAHRDTIALSEKLVNTLADLKIEKLVEQVKANRT